MRPSPTTPQMSEIEFLLSSLSACEDDVVYVSRDDVPLLLLSGAVHYKSYACDIDTAGFRLSTTTQLGGRERWVEVDDLRADIQRARTSFGEGT